MLLYTSQGECELASCLEFIFFPITETCPLLLIIQKSQYPLHRGTHLCFLRCFFMVLLTLDCIILCCGAALCIVGHWLASLAIISYIPVALSTQPPPTIHCHKKNAPDIAKLPLVENHWVIGIKKRKQIWENPGLRIWTKT